MPVWKLIACSDSSHIGIELRDAGRLQTSFAVIDIENNCLLFEPVCAPEPWWLSLELVTGNALLLHTLAAHPAAGITGIMALSTSTGNLLWQKKNIQLSEYHKDGVYVQSIVEPGKAPELLNTVAGLPVKHEQKREVVTSAPANQAQYPDAHLPGTAYYEQLHRFLTNKTSLKPTGPIEYLETTQCIVISCFEEVNQNITNYLVIFGLNGDLLHQTQLSDLKGFVTDTFFIFKGKVIAVTAQQQVLAITIELN